MAGVQDFDVVLEQNHAALGEIVKGNAKALKSLYSHEEDPSFDPRTACGESCIVVRTRLRRFDRRNQ